MVKRLIIAFALLWPMQLLAQGSLSGTVYDFENKTFPLQQVAVRNLNTKQVAVTKAAGQFTIAASKGDLIEFSLVGYHTDTLFLTDLNPKTIFLPVNAKNLKEVNIVSTKLSPYLDLKGINANTKESTRFGTDGLAGKKNGDRAGGMTFALGYGKYKRENEKLKRLEEMDLYETEINTNFNEQTISDLVKLKGQDLKDFMSMYRPSVALIKGERPFNYPFYIAQAYHRWLKLSPEEKKPAPIQKLKQN